MHLHTLQKKAWEFDENLGWTQFTSSLVFTHLIEELGEIGRYILFDEKYKEKESGHSPPDPANLEREFAHVFLLLVQLAGNFGVDLETAVLSEMAFMEKRFDNARSRVSSHRNPCEKR
ncbi:MAG: hypothetical protein ACTSW4_07625 [Candidatus Ranarchaeia archaeon]